MHIERDVGSEGEGIDPAVKEAERIGLESQEGFVRKLPDQQAPTQKEIEEHCVKAHTP